MEQMYLIEIFINKVTVFAKDDEESTGNKNLIIKINFGPKVQFIVKEGQLAVVDRPDDIIEIDEKTGRRQWTRTIRVGKSYLFPAHPDTILQTLSKFPLEVEVWNDDETELENNMFIGVGNMHWDTKFFLMLKETKDSCKVHEPLSIKTKVPLMAECCCKQIGEVDFILRLSALGNTIITEFQQLMKDPESFVFRTNKAPSMFECKRVEGDDPNFCMVGSLYETTTLEDPEIVDRAQNKIEVCTELQSCGMEKKADQYVCEHTATESTTSKKYAIDKIKMGEIRGPCGNTNCALAHKVRKYIRALDTYKAKASGIVFTKTNQDKKICGKCICKDDRWHRDSCPEITNRKVRCIGCAGMTMPGNTCEDKLNKHYGTGMTPKTSTTQINYVFSVPKFRDDKKSLFGQETIVENCFCKKFNNSVDDDNKARQDPCPSSNDEYSCRQSGTTKTMGSMTTMYSVVNNNPMTYNAEVSAPRHSIRMSTAVTLGVGTTCNQGSNADPKRKTQGFNGSDAGEDKDCKCNPKKPGPPCKTFDCDCLTETENIAARKLHKPYCPLYKHKVNCPVTMMNEEEELKKNEEDEEEVAPLPYGLPPIQLGPCPILGRPCTVPDGFARMYRNAQLPTEPYSYSEEGKVCCSKEYERIKKAIKMYLKTETEKDYRCINKFNIDTERRCCDKEQVLMTLMGKSCCGSHKMAIQDKFAEEKKEE
ncbi:hypothetical protein HF086_013600 [Spodoptera exigua]|uniref:Uncharacterized protein n=1 Tax=Spodoptera exigua TaxID=7107 RepID=A0A922SMS5_SPOEX|nr:hypothetical protein HF086_013600 [Spodoptera exigua]